MAIIRITNKIDTRVSTTIGTVTPGKGRILEVQTDAVPIHKSLYNELEGLRKHGAIDYEIVEDPGMRNEVEGAPFYSELTGHSPIGTPTDGSYSGGRVPLTPETIVADAFDEINMALLGPGMGAGWIYIEDIQTQDPSGVAVDQVYQDPPGNTVLQSVRVSSVDITVTIRASYPSVRVDATTAILPRDIGGGHYYGNVDITLGVTGKVTAVVITPEDEDGAGDTTSVLVVPPPNITALNFTGAYPTSPGGLQTELKLNDPFSIYVAANSSFDRVDVIDFGSGSAAQASITAVPVGSSATVPMSAANRGTTPQALPARVRVRDAVTGAWSATRDTNTGGGTVDGVNLVTLNNLYPSGSIGSIDYPVSQSALKNVEFATVNNTAANYNSIVYSDPTGAQLTINSPSLFEAAKIVTCRDPGIYNGSTTNFRYVMTRNANGAQTTVSGVVVIADVAPTISVSAPARLRSGGNNGTSVQNHTITISSNQPLLNAPTLNADSGGNRGTFSGSWAGGPSTWTRTLQVSELVPDEKGTFTWEGLVATGRAGLVQNTIGSGANYTLGGFVQRDLTFAAYATTTLIGTSVVTFSKLTAGIFTATNQPALRQPIGTSPPVVNGYTIAAAGVNPTTLIWLDTVAAATNSTGTAKITAVEEAI